MPDSLNPANLPDGVEIEDIGSNPSPRDTIQDIAERRLPRRGAGP